MRVIIKKVLLKLPIKIDDKSDYRISVKADDKPSAVFIASGKLFYLIAI